MLRTVQRTCALVVLAASLLSPGPAAAADTPPLVPDNDVRVERSGNTFTVDVVMHAPVPLAQAWAVVVDFGHMAEFVPNLTAAAGWRQRARRQRGGDDG